MANPSSRDLASAQLELQKLAQKRPSLSTSSRVLSATLAALFTDATPELPLSIPRDTAQKKLQDGVPLLRDLPLSIDEPALQRRWHGVCAALQQSEADALADAVRNGRLRPTVLLAEVLTSGPATMAAPVEPLGLNASLAATVLRLSALPALARITETCAELRQGAAWDAGYCPHCGSWPLLGEARGIEQDRFLRCGLCAAAWRWGRLHCPFCGNRDHQTLGYLHVEGEEDRHRAGTCEACRGYVKWTTTIAALSPPQLLVADLATLHLDLAAAERGYYVSDPEA